MPRASTEHTAEVRLRILEGAHRAFLAHGYRGTSIPVIAGEAGVSVGLEAFHPLKTLWMLWIPDAPGSVENLQEPLRRAVSGVPAV